MKRSGNKKKKAMNSLFAYLFQSAVTLAALYSFYWVFLRKDTFFRINRAYLLCTILLSAVLPLIPFSFFATGTPSTLVVLLDPVIITPEKLDQARANNLSWFEIAGVVYLTGAAFFFARLIAQLIQIARIIRRNRITRSGGMNLVFMDWGFSPFSFFNIVFIGKEFLSDDNTAVVLVHEKVHVQQMHTIDLLLVELMTIIQWFNPFIWLLGKSIKGIHEFIADEGVLKTGYKKADYQKLIFHEAVSLQINSLTNHFNVSLIKNRIHMMTKSRSGAWAASKVLFILPAILFLAFFFSAGKTSSLFAQETKKEEPKSLGNSKGIGSPQAQDPKSADKVTQSSGDEVFVQVEDMPSYPGGDEARVKFMLENIKYPETAKKKGIMGTVFIQFIVEKDGTISGAKILRGFDLDCDKEALRVVNLMPKWNPGKQRGQVVRVQFVLPIKFALDAGKDKKVEKKQ
jgi:TonB family protein